MNNEPDLDSAILLVSCLIEMSASDYRNLKKTLATATDPIDISDAKCEMEQIERFFRESPLVSELGVDGNNIIDRLINEEVENNAFKTKVRGTYDMESYRKIYYQKNKKEKTAQAMSRYYKLKEQGICVRCGRKQAREGKTICEKCEEKQKKLRKKKP